MNTIFIEEKLTSVIEALGRLLKMPRRADVVNGVLALCREVIPADGYVIWQQSRLSGSWTILGESGISAQYTTAIQNQVNENQDLVADRNNSHWIEDETNQAWNKSTKDLYRAAGIISILVVVLEFQEHSIGKLCFYFKDSRQLSQADSRIVTALADISAVAIGSTEFNKNLHAGFLAELGVIFNATTDCAKTLDSFAGMAVPYFADWCAVELLKEDDSLEMVALVHPDPVKVAAARKFRLDHPSNMESNGDYATALKTGRSNLVEDWKFPLMAPAHKPEYRHFLKLLSMASSLIVPIRIRERSIGLITFLQTESERHFTESDRLFAEELARRVATMVDNAMLQHRSREAIHSRDELLRKLQKQIKQQAALTAISQRGLSQTDPVALFEDTVFWLMKTLRIERCMILESSDNSLPFLVKAVSGWDADEISRHLGDQPTDQLLRQVLDSPSPLLFESLERDDQLRDLTLFKGSGISSAILTRIRPPDESNFGLIGAFSEKPNAFSQDDIQFLQSIANILAATVDRFETERALRISEQKYRQLFDLSPNGIVIADVDFRITGLNNEALKIFAIETEIEILGTDLRQLILPLQNTDLLIGFGSPVDSDAVRDREITLKRRDGGEFSAEVSAEAIKDQNGARVAFFGIVRDITQRKELEQMKNEFITTTSHELRTPLTSIYISLELIANGRVPLGSEKMSTLIQVAYKNCRRLILLINDFLDFQRMQLGKIDFGLQATDLTATVRQAMQMNQAYAEQYGIHFVLDLQSPAANIIVDPNRFAQVLANLLSNAAKFSHEGGTVSIRTRCSDSEGQVSVINNGPAIPDEYRAQLFTKFFQLDSSLKRKRQGSGLGLAISKSLVESMGGRIDFKSGPDETEFFVNFPLATSSSDNPLAVDCKPGAKNGK